MPEPSLLRFMTCGSVDDGKSTLIGRLLHDAHALYADQLTTLAAESKAGQLDFALLVDGLAAEREQGITIDVAYRYFATDRRRFIVADAPGHAQYTRNMVTAASTADLAILLVDARKGLLDQTRRHAVLARLMGVRRTVLAVTKMDLIGWDEAVFRRVVEDHRVFAERLEAEPARAIPLSGLNGDNILRSSAASPWYDGPALLPHLEQVEVEAARLQARPLRLPVQWVNRPDADFRGYAGRLTSGVVRPGDPVRIAPSGRTTTVSRVIGPDGDLDLGVAGQSLTLTLADEVDCARGDLIAAADDPPEVADQFRVTLIWMAEEPLLPGRAWLLKIGTRTVTATVTEIRHRLNVETLDELAARQLELNDIGDANLSLDQAMAFDAYDDMPGTGGFILIDRVSHATVAAGLVRFALRRSHNIHWQALDVDKGYRAAAKAQAPTVLWFTGLSGAGKSTIANLVERRLSADGRHTYLLDGDNVRHGLSRDLGFTEADRVENIRRVAEVARLMADAGLIVLVSLISPFTADRRMARERMAPGEFVEVFVDAPLAVAESRDAKGLYAKARRGELSNFTGVDSPYERPDDAEITLDTVRLSPEQAADVVVEGLRALGRLP